MGSFCEGANGCSGGNNDLICVAVSIVPIPLFLWRLDENCSTSVGSSRHCDHADNGAAWSL